MSVIVTDVQRFIVDAVTGTGVDLRFITVVVKNRDRVTQETFGPADLQAGLPPWLTRATDGSGYFFTLNLTLDDVTYMYQPDFVLLQYTVQTATLINLPVIEKSVPLAASSAPTADAGKELYAEVAYADAFFNRRVDGRDWNTFSQIDKWRLLYEGSDDIDTETYKGHKRVAEGNLDDAENETWGRRAFPRYMPEFSFNGSFVDNADEIPTNVKAACCLQALYLGRTLLAGQDPNDRRNLQRFGVGSWGAGRQNEASSIAESANNRLCSAADDLLRRYYAVSVEQGFG